MQVVCPSCDAQPAPGVTAGAACSACHTPLVALSEPENLIGTVIDDRFEILDRLGSGGMGAVYRARQRSIGRDVALKVIDRAMETDVVAVKRFLREAKVASALAHPNTVGVIEFGQSSTGRLYLVMELVRGKTLKDALHGAPVELARLVRIGVQLCDALEAAHALGIVHRDLKLENVMLLDGPKERDHVKILDFGLARHAAEESRATATGLIAGTPRYLPPEVAYGNAEPAPPQDMYALGVMLGELATGKTLWEGPTLEALFTAKLTSTPQLDGVPSELRGIIVQLLDNDPRRRPSAAATRDALVAVTEETTLLGLGVRSPNAAWSIPSDAPLALEAAANRPPLSASAFAPPSLDATADRAPLPASAFAPPAETHAPLDVDGDWQREKAAKAAMAQQPPPRPPFKLWGVIAALAIVAIVATVVIIIGTTPGKATPPTPHASELPATANTVSIEIRTRPPGVITIDGRKAGPSPLTLHIPKGTKSLQIGAELQGHPLSRTVVPDRDQSIDFTYP